jgi:two-component system heavy metal sensor histidine kinase CusS
MIEKMLFLARAENAQVALHRDNISVGLELKRIAGYFEGMANETGVTLDVDASGVLVADGDLFRRAVSNLVANALRHTPSGGHVTIRGHEQEPGKFAVAVSNPGSGIPPEHLPRIFDRFYRVDDSRGESQSSSGLGLAIVKSIVNLHGGSVRVESIPNGLTTFSLIFPRG